MKRRIITIVSAVMALMMICSLAGCKSSGSQAEQTGTQAAQTETQAAAKSSTAAIDPADAIFYFRGIKIELNAELEPILAPLDEPLSVSSQLSCHGEGEDKTYTYDGFIINTYPLEGKDRILEVVIQNAGIPTTKGVQVGDPVSKATEAYGDGYRAVGMYYAYDAGDGKSLQFFIENDTIKEIDYYYDV